MIEKKFAIKSDDDPLMKGHSFDHTVKISHCKSGGILTTAEGHPRTPWTKKYHPIQSGCYVCICSQSIDGSSGSQRGYYYGSIIYSIGFEECWNFDGCLTSNPEICFLVGLRGGCDRQILQVSTSSSEANS